MWFTFAMNPQRLPLALCACVALAATGCSGLRQGAVLAGTTAAGAGIAAAASGGNPLATAGGGAAGLVAGLGVNALADAQERHQEATAEEQARAQEAHEAYFRQQEEQGQASPAGTQHYYQVVLPAQTDSYGVKRVPAQATLSIVE